MPERPIGRGQPINASTSERGIGERHGPKVVPEPRTDADTKVLTRLEGRLAYDQGRVLVPASPNVTDAKRQETRVTLRELGLEEKLEGD